MSGFGTGIADGGQVVLAFRRVILCVSGADAGGAECARVVCQRYVLAGAAWYVQIFRLQLNYTHQSEQSLPLVPVPLLPEDLALEVQLSFLFS